MIYKIGTRGSKLAISQTQYVQRKLQNAFPQDEFVLEIITTKGDKILDKPLEEIGGKGIFVNEIQEKLISGEIQMAVHSMKDMPAELEPGLTFSKIWKRENTKDVLILREANSLEELPTGAVIGTGSARRARQLEAIRCDLKIVNIRGNIDTRIKKMHEQKLDGIILAAAGLARLNKLDVVTKYFEYNEMIPAPAQGTLAIQLKEDNVELLNKINSLSHEDTHKCVEAERIFLKEIGGDCHLPIGAHCEKVSEKNYSLDVVYGNNKKLAYSHKNGEYPKELAVEAAKDIRKQLAGMVYLIGAGPGDPGLLTCKGLELIQNADCILVDRLVSGEILKYTKEDCEIIYVGKKNHEHSVPQKEIQKLLVKKSLEYSSVVRLKGGDVYIFGRGGEEGEYLYEKGVRFEVVPGVTSAIAGLAYAGIPATYRGESTGVHIMTAHNKEDKLTDLDYSSLITKQDTNVFLMGLSNLEKLVKNLIENGMSKSTPAAVISNATTPEQKKVISSLSELPNVVKQNEIMSPALIVTGEVVKHAQNLDFFEKKVLFGRRYLVPKIGNQKSSVSKLLSGHGAAVDEIQVGEIKYYSEVITEEQLSRTNWIIFGSKHGVKGFFNDLLKNGIDFRQLSHIKFATVGEKTSKVLRNYGFISDFTPDENNGVSLANQLRQIVKKTDFVLNIKAENSVDTIAFSMAGKCIYESISIYENKSILNVGKIDYNLYDAVFFSCSSSVERLFADLENGIQEHINRDVRIYAMGRKTEATLNKMGFKKVYVPEQTSYEAMAELEVRMWQNMPI